MKNKFGVLFVMRLGLPPDIYKLLIALLLSITIHMLLMIAPSKKLSRISSIDFDTYSQTSFHAHISNQSFGNTKPTSINIQQDVNASSPAYDIPDSTSEPAAEKSIDRTPPQINPPTSYFRYRIFGSNGLPHDAFHPPQQAINADNNKTHENFNLIIEKTRSIIQLEKFTCSIFSESTFTVFFLECDSMDALEIFKKSFLQSGKKEADTKADLFLFSTIVK
jgi:hypothetical protein